MPTILVVDDSLSVRKVAERQLTEAGLEVAVASNGEEAVTWMSTNRPDLVIADVIMPEKSGFEVCKFVKSNAALADTPVILVSGFVDEDLTRQAEACHADGIIKKPFQGAALRERVLEMLSGRKATAPQAPGADRGPALLHSSTSPAQALQQPLTEQEKALEQVSTLIQDLTARLVDAANHSAELQKELAALEQAAASAEKLLKMLGESVRQSENAQRTR